MKTYIYLVKKSNKLIAIFFFCFCFYANSQNTFIRHLPISNLNFALGYCKTYDNGFVATGQDDGVGGNGSCDFHVEKFDECGNIVWYKRLGTPNATNNSGGNVSFSEGGVRVIETVNHDIIMIGLGMPHQFKDSASQNWDGRIVRLDANGNVVWDKAFGNRIFSSLADMGLNMMELPNGNIACIGFVSPQFGAAYYPYLLMLSANGSFIYDKVYEGTNGELNTAWPHGIDIDASGNLVISGSCVPGNIGSWKNFFLKVDVNSGAVLTCNIFSVISSATTLGWDWKHGFKKLSNGNFAVLTTAQMGANLKNMSVLYVLDNNGNPLWANGITSTTFANPNTNPHPNPGNGNNTDFSNDWSDDNYDVYECANGDLATLGSVNTGSYYVGATDENGDPYLVTNYSYIALRRYTSAGQIKFSNLYGDGNSVNKARGVIETKDKGFFLNGYTTGFGSSLTSPNYYDPLFIKTDSLGKLHNNCYSQPDNVTIVSLTPTITPVAVNVISNNNYYYSPIPLNSIPFIPQNDTLCFYCNNVPSFVISKDTVCIGQPFKISNNTSVGLKCSQRLTIQDLSGNAVAILDTIGTDTLQYKINTPGKYIITLKSTCGALNFLKDSIIVLPNPIITVASVTICAGQQTATLTAIGAYTYTWAPTTGLSLTTGSTVSVNPPSTQSYSLTGTDKHGCINTGTTSVIVKPIPVATITTFTNVSCSGGNNGSATAGVIGGTSPYVIGWSNNTFTYTANSLTTGTYTFGVKDSYGCKDTVSVTITQPAAMSVSISTQTNVSCFGLHDGDAIASVLGGLTPYAYLWSNGNTSIKDTSLAKGVYTFTVTDANNCTNTASVTITQPTILKDSIKTFTNVSCFGLSNGSATAGVTGGTHPYLVGWSNHTFNYITNSLTAGTYTFGVQDAHGCKDTVSITITQPAILKDSITTFVNVSCFGLHNGSATGGVTGGTTPYTYSWSNGNNLIKDTALVAGVYTLTVTDAHLCKDTVSVRITQPTLLKDSTITFKNDSCFGNSNGSATAIFVGGILPYNYLWSNGNTSATDTLLPQGNYTLTTIDAHGCKATATVTISQPPVLKVTSTPKLICINNTATLTALATGGNTLQSYTYSIAGAATNTVSVNPITTTVYTLQVTDMKHCVATNTVTVFVRDSLRFLAVSPTSERCPGFSANLNATGSGGDSTFTYTWKPGAIVSQNITVTPATTTVYTVTLNDACGTPTVSAIDSVIIDPLPQISFSTDKQNGCYPLCVQFTNTTTIASGDNITYSWDLGHNYLSTNVNPYQCYATSGIYTVNVTATSTKGCISKQSVPNMITVYPHPKADFTFSPEDATIINPTIQFTSTSTAADSTLLGVFWQSFGDGSDSSSIKISVSHTYKDTGAFCPKLIVTNILGCKDSITECVIIKPYFTLYIPNSFTPNNDGRNEIFNVMGDYILSFDMKIYDRWGTQIFHSSDIKNGWNGTRNGEQLQEDVYVYVINVWDIFNRPHDYNGTVTLIK